MYDITVISMIVAGIVALVRHHGGIAFILKFIHHKIRGKKDAPKCPFVCACGHGDSKQYGEIVVAGPIAKEIGDEYQVEPKRVYSSRYLSSATSGVDSIWGATAFGGIVNRIITF